MKNIFNALVKTGDFLSKTFGNTQRYIKHDGSGYHSKGFKALSERPEFTMATITTGLSAVHVFANQGSLSPFTMDMAGAMTHTLLGVGLAYALTSTHHMVNTLSRIKRGHAIDTHGTTLDRAQLSIDEYAGLESTAKHNTIISGFFFSVGAYGAGSLCTDAPTFMATSYGFCYATYCLSVAYRANKILDGYDQTNGKRGYVYCDKPPAETVKKKISVPLAGKTVPTP